jgi:4'-phosphopantetheinyl transferase
LARGLPKQGSGFRNRLREVRTAGALSTQVNALDENSRSTDVCCINYTIHGSPGVSLRGNFAENLVAYKSDVRATGLELKVYFCGEIATDVRPRALPADEVHVWYRPLTQDIPNLGSFHDLLSTNEQEKACRYRFDRHRNEFILTRATLRILLASYLEKSPEQFTFAYSAQGKPSLANETADLRFNVSHTDGLAALAFARRREIGVDVEKIRPDCDAAKLAERFFSASEREYIVPLSGHALDEAFFHCWTRKEAFIKAKGGGLSIPLDQFDVSIAEGKPAALLATRPDPAEARRWQLHNLPVQSGYAAALAISVPNESGDAQD